MELQLLKTAGQVNEVFLIVARDELRQARLSVPCWNDLMQTDGLVRWRGRRDFEACAERAVAWKRPIEQHHEALQITDEDGAPTERIVSIGNRNLGNNLGFVAWDRSRSRRLFHLRSEPLSQRAYDCLCWRTGARLSVESLILQSPEAMDPGLLWATSGTPILRNRRVTPVEQLIEDAYDIRMLFAFDGHRSDGRRELDRIYGDGEAFDFDGFKRRAIESCRNGAPRSRYFHSGVGLGETHLVLFLAEGTPEEIAVRLREAGCRDALILDQGGSAGIWGWWITRSEDLLTGARGRGGYLATAPDFRPLASSVLVLSLQGPVRSNLPPGSASTTVV